MKYSIRFRGRLRGAIGVFHVIDADVDADANNEPAAVLKLYDTYEHIQQPILVALDDVTLPNGGRMMQWL